MAEETVYICDVCGASFNHSRYIQKIPVPGFKDVVKRKLCNIELCDNCQKALWHCVYKGFAEINTISFKAFHTSIKKKFEKGGKIEGIPNDEEKLGFWRKEEVDGQSPKFFCSECGAESHRSGGFDPKYSVADLTPFCPTCGLKMELDLKKSELKALLNESEDE